MPAEETPRQKKQASNPESSDSMELKSKKFLWTISRSFGCCCPVLLRTIERTAVTSGSSRHSRKTPCPTIPDAPKRITLIRLPPPTKLPAGEQNHWAPSRSQGVSVAAAYLGCRAPSPTLGGWRLDETPRADPDMLYSPAPSGTNNCSCRLPQSPWAASEADLHET